MAATVDVNAYLNEAVTAYQQRNLPLVDVLCDILLDQGCTEPLCQYLMGLVALQVQEYKRAVPLLQEASAKTPRDTELKRQLEAARKALREQGLMRPDGRKRYLVIKPWGYGFCSDMDHVLGDLFLAELTGRTPIVWWGEGSLFKDEVDENAWPRFFEPVSKVSLAEATVKGAAYFPPKWNEGNIKAADVNKLEGDQSRMAGFFFLNRREEVAVSDFHVAIASLINWARPGTPFYKKPLHEAYRAIVKKYLRPTAAVTERVEAFAKEFFGTGPVVAAHVRGSDKLVEDVDLKERNQNTPGVIDGLIAQHPTIKVFLLTDDAAIKAVYADRYGDRLITTDCLRTTTARGLHYTEHESRTRLGIEVLVDMYLAARCDYFVGVGSSNVSAMIEHLKEWPKDSIWMQGYSIHYGRNPFLWRWTFDPAMEAEMKAAVDAQAAREAATQAPPPPV